MVVRERELSYALKLRRFFELRHILLGYDHPELSSSGFKNDLFS